MWNESVTQKRNLIKGKSWREVSSLFPSHENQYEPIWINGPIEYMIVQLYDV